MSWLIIIVRIGKKQDGFGHNFLNNDDDFFMHIPIIVLIQRPLKLFSFRL